MKIETKFVNPQMAEEMLSTSSFNRPVAQARVLTLANEMRTGKWQLNGETIIFSESGKLLDGQHRLYAIIDSGCTVQMTLAYGAPENSFETIDTGRSRSGGDILAMNGIEHAVIASAACSMIWRLWHNVSVQEVCVPAFQLRVYEKFPAIGKWAPFVHGGRRAAIVPSSAFLTSLTYLEDVARKPAMTARFYEGIVKGANLAEGDPILALRNRMLNMRGENRLMNNTTCWSAVARTLSALEADESLSVLRTDKSHGVVRRPTLWQEHASDLSPSMSLNSLYPADESGGSRGAAMKDRVQEIRARAKG